MSGHGNPHAPSKMRTAQLLWKAIGQLLKGEHSCCETQQSHTQAHTQENWSVTTHTHLHTDVHALFLTAKNGNDANVRRQKCE